MLEEGANLIIYDPKVSKEQVKVALALEDCENNSGDNSSLGNWTYAEIYDVFKSSDCVVFITEWKVFSEINWGKAAKDMRHPAWVFDTRGIIDKRQVIESGLNFWEIGIGNS